MSRAGKGSVGRVERTVYLLSLWPLWFSVAISTSYIVLLCGWRSPPGVEKSNLPLKSDLQ